MIRSFVARTSVLLASATLAFLLVSPVAVTPASGGTLSFPSTCSVTDNGGGNFTMTCGGNPPTFTCSIIGAPSGSVAVNTFVSLFMSCNGGTQPYQYLWSPGGATSASLQVPTTAAGTTRYTVIATDAANATSTQFVDVTVSSGGGGGGGSLANCTNQGLSVIPANPVVVTWGQPLSLQSTQSGNFGDNTVWVFQMFVPPGTPTSLVKGRFVVVEYQGNTTFRQMTISKSPCDFRQKDYAGLTGPLGVSNGTTVSLYFGVGTPFIFGDPALTAGETYYFNIRNWQLDPTPQSSCGQASCNAVVNEQPASP